MAPTLVRSAVLALAVAATSTAGRAQSVARDETAKGYAFVELVLPDRAPFVGEPFVVRLRAGVDVDVLEANLVQPFRQLLDVPVQLDHPWFEGTPDAPLPLGPPRAAGAGDDPARAEEPGEAAALDLARVALGGELVHAARHSERNAAGRRFTVLEFERVFVVDSARELTAAAPRLGFAYALEFRDDLVAGRVAVDRHDGFVRGVERTLAVRGLPDAGQPFSFTGAVGRYALDARTEPAALEPDGLVRMTVTLTADGPLGPFDPPRFDRLGPFEVRASRDTSEGRRRTFELEFAPTRTGRLTLAPVEFAYFDPGVAAYVELSTERAEVLVGAPTRVEPPRVTAADAPEGPNPTPLGEGFSMRGATVGLVAAAVVGCLVLAVLLVWAFGRRREA